MKRFYPIGMAALMLAACGGGGGGGTVASVTVTPAAPTLLAGATVQLAATTKDAAGNVLTGRAVTWASSNTAFATVTGSGLVTGVEPGSATVTATSEGQSGRAAVTVRSLATADLFSVWALAFNHAFAVGELGIILHYDGTSWSPLASGTTNALYAMGPELVVVGAEGTILHPSTPVTWNPRTSGTTNTLYRVARAPGGTLVAVGAAGTILTYNGTSWSPQTSGTTSTLRGVSKVPLVGMDVAVGVGGTILSYTPLTGWTAQASGTSNDLFFVGALSATNVHALGAAGTVLHYDGTRWSPVPTGLTVALRAADVVSTPTGTITDFFVVGDGGTILHSSDGVMWSRQTSGTTNDLFGVGAISARDVFAVGAGGTILHYDGTAWGKQR